MIRFFELTAMTPSDQAAIYVGSGLVTLLGVYILVLKSVEATRSAFGRKPSIEVSLEKKADGAHVERLEVDIKGFTSLKEFEAHKEEVRLRTLGLEKQISESRHDWQREIQGILAIATDRDETANAWRDEISGELKTTGKELSAVKQQANMIQATQQNMDAKIDRLIERHIPAPTR